MPESWVVAVLDRLTRATEQHKVVWSWDKEAAADGSVLTAEVSDDYALRLALVESFKDLPSGYPDEGPDHVLTLLRRGTPVATVDRRDAGLPGGVSERYTRFTELWKLAWASANGATERHLRTVSELLERL